MCLLLGKINMAKPRIKVGDVFSIPIDENRVGYGQVIFKNHSSFPIYIAVFRTVYECSSQVAPSAITNDEIALVGGTMDALICHGRWNILGNVSPDLARIPRPNFKVIFDNIDYLEDFDGNRLREATSIDVRYYDDRWTRAPIAFQSALKALHGIGTWDFSFDKLTIQHALAQAT
jgi:Immunity protein 26